MLGYLQLRITGNNDVRLQDLTLIFLSQPFVSFLTVTRDTARHYGRIMSGLRAAGTKVPTNDAWIAAFALENDASLWTHDKHFDHVEGIDVRPW